MISNEYYDLRYDQEKNRIYFKIKGFWPSTDTVPGYLDKWKDIVKQTKPEFTVLGDITEMKVPPQEIMNLHVEVQNLVLEKGMRKAAEIVDESILKLAVNRIARSSGLYVVKRQFHEYRRADAWLDSKED